MVGGLAMTTSSNEVCTEGREVGTIASRWLRQVHKVKPMIR